MKISLKYSINKNDILLFVLVASVIYVLISDILFYYKINSPYFPYAVNYLAFGISFISSVFILFKGSNKPIFKLKIFYTILLLNLMTIFTTLTNYNSIIYGNRLILVVMLFMWCAVFIISFESIYHNNNFYKATKYIIFICPIFIYLFITHTFSYDYIINRQPNTVYYSLFFLPFILTSKKKYLKQLGVIAIFICILISVKRTAFIAFALSIFVYYIVLFKNNNILSKKNLYTLLTFLSITIICVFSYNSVIDYYNVDIIARFDQIMDDRADIWLEVWRQQTSSDFSHWILGKGWNGVVNNANISNRIENLSAHNDFLEVLYDYGIFGFILYITLLLQLIVYAKKMISDKFELGPAFTASIALFLVVSLTSHLIIYPNYFYLLMLFWGASIAHYEKLIKSNQKQVL